MIMQFAKEQLDNMNNTIDSLAYQIYWEKYIENGRNLYTVQVPIHTISNEVYDTVNIIRTIVRNNKNYYMSEDHTSVIVNTSNYKNVNNQSVNDDSDSQLIDDILENMDESCYINDCMNSINELVFG